MGELYVIWNEANDKLYIGITTVGYKCRFKKHLRNAKNGINSALYRAIRKYGPENFHVECLLDNIPEDRLYLFEIACISHFDSKRNGYNLTSGGDGILNPSEETRNKMSRAKQGYVPWNKGISGVMKAWNKGVPMSEERKKEQSKRMVGRSLTEEHKRKISLSGKGRVAWNRGIPAWNRGIPMSEEQRTKMKWIVSDETKRKISISNKGRIPWNKGKKFSEEVKRKISESHTGKRLSLETRQKIGQGNKNKIVSEETKRRMSESAKKRYVS